MKMKRVLIICPSTTDNSHTYALAKNIQKGINSCKGITSSVYAMEDVSSTSEILLEADGIAVGSPVCLANPSYVALKFIEEVL
eukprot:Awhi_evm1s11028